MKPVVVYLSIALLTLILGISAIIFCLPGDTGSVPSPLKHATYPVDYDELTIEPERYVGKMIRLRVRTSAESHGPLTGRLYRPRRPWQHSEPVFFGVEYAPDSEESAAQVNKVLSIRIRNVYMMVVGEWIRNETRKDFDERTFPYWLIVRRVEEVEIE